jgi:hypothetical protein
MRNGQKRMRGRNSNNNNNRKSQNPLTRVYESNGPDVKIRGTASHIAEKYIQLARDSQSSGDPVAAENYYQHAEHYFRLIAVAQEQFRQQNPYYNAQPQQGQSGAQGAADDNYDDGDDEGQPFLGQNEPSYAPQPQQQPQQQPYLPRDAQPFPPRDQQQHSRPPHQPQQQPSTQGGNVSGPDVTGLPSFITGGGQPQQPNPGQNGAIAAAAVSVPTVRISATPIRKARRRSPCKAMAATSRRVSRSNRKLIAHYARRAAR